ncbi:MAG TPA: translation initiation factor IF-2, partial [Acidobacteriota bacterium]|nr:translation initiation factor IF-2 [Acidobacteriota bacterium]
MKTKINQIAKDLGRQNAEVMDVLHKLGVDAKTAQSSIDETLVPKIKKELESHAAKKKEPAKHVVEDKTKKKPEKPAAKVEKPADKTAKVAAEKAKEKPAPKKKAAQPAATAKAVHPPRARHSKEPASVEEAAAVEREGPTIAPQQPAAPSISDEELERLTAPELAAPAEEEAAPQAAPIVSDRPKIQISENISIKDLAQKLGVMSKVLLKKLLDRGIFANINQNIDMRVAEQLANEFGFDIQVTTYEEVVAKEQEAEETEAGLMIRPPVVTIMGHVDHGKTSLLDAIRESNIAAGEHGGITQHIGAYQVRVKNGRAITFIDTPGHEAFTRMRARGALVTDIVILVVAADDGVMPQTLEAIDHARAAKVPIIVAINKIDKPNANPEKIKQQLAQQEILIEEYGGETVAVEISARKGTNIDVLLEMILLVADILELKSSPARLAMGTILEARLDKARGPIATVLVQNGTLRATDVFVAGAVMGRVRAMFNDSGIKMKDAFPGAPVEVLGFQGVPQAGDAFQVFKDEFKARSIVAFRQTKAREQATQPVSRLSLDQLFSKIQQGEIRELPIIIKADVQGSIEVLTDTLSKLGTSEVKIRIIHSGTGAVTLSDVLLASASNAIIVAYNVRPEPKARDLAEKEKVDIRNHTVIYNIVSEIKSALEGLLQPTLKEVFVGSAQVRDTFKIPKVGTIAGCFVTAGKLTRNSQVRLLRDNVVVYEGKISSLRRFKDD